MTEQSHMMTALEQVLAAPDGAKHGALLAHQLAELAQRIEQQLRTPSTLSHFEQLRAAARAVQAALEILQHVTEIDTHPGR
ncbi:hypothetical protein PIN31115_04490 [Pandoraea iniqua]|uniref:EscE/YscE/SsaE family type III secretion system needle protein co-chaperone n=1 Tax=Pandoraea iniqua TaxID=2508288 RepID=A0A5E4YGM6_9BURK|nr:EscE/YscE/SsaE family type III secretion system needle protein co-chaperone [Pandoraea iniqua]VVE47881.1 hypothetical protein PIN31115_04490 [Pandoraea iniqua]